MEEMTEADKEIQRLMQEERLKVRELKSIGKLVNYNDFILWLKDDDTYEVCYCSNSSIVTAEVPSICNGKPVTTIGPNAFSYCDYDDIGFNKSGGIYSKTKTFVEKCKSLTTIVIPDSITDIYDRKPNLWIDSTYNNHKVSLCYSYLGGAYNMWSKLLKNVSIRIDSNNPNYMMANGGLYAKKEKALLCSNGESPLYAILDGTTEIKQYAMADYKNLESLVIPVSVKSFGIHVFPSYNLKTIFYKGTKDDWKKITIAEANDDELRKATVYFYSETPSGNSWHYAADGETPEITNTSGFTKLFKKIGIRR